MKRKDNNIKRYNHKKRKKKNVTLRVSLALILVSVVSFLLGQLVIGQYQRISYKAAVTDDKVDDKNKQESKKEVLTDKKEEENISDPKPNEPNETNETNDIEGKKIAYLTFDDGPTKNVTPKVLKILKEYNVKATFFVIGELAEKNSDLIKQEDAEGHAVGNHTYSHNYHNVYSSENNFMKEVDKANDVVQGILGPQYNRKIFRFPGGSFETRKQPFKNCLSNAGYKYFDWNALNGDAEGQNVSPEKLLERLKETTAGQEHITILMHDAATKETTVQALPNIIEYLKSEGYEFRTLN